MNRAKIFIVLTFLLASAVCVSAQTTQFPNELKGYEFFGNGRLKDLKLTVSSKDDVRKIFGQDCEKQCDYDTEWFAHFEYYEDIWISESRNEEGEKLTFLLDTKYLGKLCSIEIRSRKEISFADISFPKTFEKLITTSTVDAHSGRSKMTVNDAFRHSDGLTYEIYSRTNYDDINNKKAKSYNAGDLVLIRYNIPKELEKTLFVLQR